MQRYFGKLDDQGNIILLEEDIFHVIKVMRARVNDLLEVVIDEQVILASIHNLHPFSLKVVERRHEDRELKGLITLYYAMPKGDKLDWVLQKATELGVSRIVLLSSKRTIVKVDEMDKPKKIIRYQKILKEASEQAKRTKIPLLVDILDFSFIEKASGDIKLIADEDVAGKTTGLMQILKRMIPGQSIDILVGPEGGFERSEVKDAVSHGFQPISLGKRILRSETAVINLLSIISFMMEGGEQNGHL